MIAVDVALVCEFLHFQTSFKGRGRGLKLDSKLSIQSKIKLKNIYISIINIIIIKKIGGGIFCYYYF